VALRLAPAAPASGALLDVFIGPVPVRGYELTVVAGVRGNRR